MRRVTSILLPITFLLLLFGCSGHEVTEYKNLKPDFDLFRFFEGKSWGRGIVFDRSGKMTRQFVVDITGTVKNDNTLTLDEKFRWNDGERTSRVWTITRKQQSNTTSYSGTAADVVGTAAGRSAGNSLNWSYTLALQVDGSSWNINFDDWMFLQEGNILFNRAIMSKFGFRVGEVFIIFSRDPGFVKGGTP